METLAIKLNNPLNIRYSRESRWKGLVGSEKGFCKFQNNFFGFRAAFYIIFIYMKRHNLHTPSEIIHRWAPPSENNTNNYIRFVCSFEYVNQETGEISSLQPDHYINPFDVAVIYLVIAMARFESGKWFSLEDCVPSFVAAYKELYLS